MSRNWFAELTPPEQEQWREDCRQRALVKNAQRGQPHRNPDAVSRGVQLALAEGRQQRYYGPDNPHWKGGPKDVGYNCQEWRDAAGAARKRDNNTCVKCHQVGDQPSNRIEVDHMCNDTFCRILEHLQTLCARCHREVTAHRRRERVRM
jgi:hypothetical protein